MSCAQVIETLLSAGQISAGATYMARDQNLSPRVRAHRTEALRTLLSQWPPNTWLLLVQENTSVLSLQMPALGPTGATKSLALRRACK